VPRGKWNCPGCTQRGPRKSSKATKRKAPTHLLQGPDMDDSSTTNSPKSVSEKEPAAPPLTKKEKVSETKQTTRNSSKENGKVEKDRQTKKNEKDKTKEDQNNDLKATTTRRTIDNKKRKLTKADKDLTICSTLISEMEAHEDSGPFLFPVNTKQFATYKKVIKTPMDIATIKKKLDLPVSNAASYKSRDEFVEDVRLIFTNCEVFNEDDSPVGKAGHTMRNLFETRWTELTN
jgi:hypothetical protein